MRQFFSDPTQSKSDIEFNFVVEERTIYYRKGDVIHLGRKHGNDVFMVRFLKTDRMLALRQFGVWASNPDLSFTWYDASVLGTKMKEILEQQR